MFLLLFSIAIDGFFSSFRVHCWRKEAKLKTQFFRSPNGATRMRWFIRKCAVLMIATTIFWSSSSSLNEVCCRLPDGVDRQTARALCQSIDFCFLAFSFPPFFLLFENSDCDLAESLDDTFQRGKDNDN